MKRRFILFLGYLLCCLSMAAGHRRRITFFHNKKITRSPVVIWDAYQDRNKIELSSYISTQSLQIWVLKDNGAVVYNQSVFLPAGMIYQFAIPEVAGDYQIILKDGQDEYSGKFNLSEVK